MNQTGHKSKEKKKEKTHTPHTDFQFLFITFAFTAFQPDRVHKKISSTHTQYFFDLPRRLLLRVSIVLVLSLTHSIFLYQKAYHKWLISFFISILLAVTKFRSSFVTHVLIKFKKLDLPSLFLSSSLSLSVSLFSRDDDTHRHQSSISLSRATQPQHRIYTHTDTHTDSGQVRARRECSLRVNC